MKVIGLLIGEPNNNIFILNICWCILALTLVYHLDLPSLALVVNFAALLLPI
jgi:hypothetical protein